MIDCMPQISLIVPVYNAAMHLHRCIDSLLEQSFRDFELLLINDGSKDGSREICDDYATKDARVRVFHKANGGVSSARNMGLNNAIGIWIAFVDSDDWVTKDYLKNLFYHTQMGVDLVVSFPTYVYANGALKKPKYPSRLINEQNFEDIFVQHSMHQNTSPWCKLFRRELIESANIRFCEDMHIGEDLLFLYSYLLFTANIYISSNNDYMYRYDLQSSLTKRVNPYKSEYAGYVNIKHVVKDLIKKRNINSLDSLQRLGWIIGYYTRNVLNSLYYDVTLKREQRLTILKDLNLEPYFIYLNITAKKEKFLVSLLKNKLYILYDLVRIAGIRTKITYYGIFSCNKNLR